MTQKHTIILGINQIELIPFKNWLKSQGHQVTQGKQKENILDGKSCYPYGSSQSKILESLFVRFTSKTPSPIEVNYYTVTELAQREAKRANVTLVGSPRRYSKPDCSEWLTSNGITIRVHHSKVQEMAENNVKKN